MSSRTRRLAQWRQLCEKAESDEKFTTRSSSWRGGVCRTSTSGRGRGRGSIGEYRALRAHQVGDGSRRPPWRKWWRCVDLGVRGRTGRPWQKCFEGEAKEVSLRSEQEGDMTGCNSRRGAQRCVEEAESIAMKCDGYCWPY
mmetsp:Transcript_29121/g.77745  ORF Transcript_29121/g.77745 Transcript_29121/m.77745 type:complete len:141 (-) Transcript_29121:141-563(-)